MCVQESAFINMTTISNTKIDDQRYLDRKQLANRWSTSIATLKRLEKTGVLNVMALSERVLRYDLEDIERIEAEQASAGKGEQ